MKNKYAAIIASSALAISIALVPATSLAASSTGSHANANWFSELGAWFNFGARTAHADDATSTPRNLPPSISGVSSPTVLTVNTEGTWSVSASDPENGALSYSVDWGDQAARPFLAALLQAPAFVQTSTFTHAYTAAGTYTVKFTVKDDAGKTSSSSVTVHVVAAPKVLAISNVEASSATQSHATVRWTTNVRSNSEVFYSTSTPVDLSSAASTNGNSNALDHTVVLNNLSAGTTYYVVAESSDAAGDSATSSEVSVTTKAAPASKAPTIASFSGPSTIVAGTEGTWTADASDPSNSSLSYSIDWGDSLLGAMMRALALGPAFVQTSTFTHTYSAAGTYTITLTAKDSAGLSTTSTTTVVVTAAAPTTTAPVISGITAMVGDNQVTFNWNTDENADSEVYYSTTSPVVIGATSTTAVTDPTSLMSHSATAADLTAGTTYYFLIQSVDADGNTTVTPQFSLTTMSL